MSLNALTNNWTSGAAGTHTTASVSLHAIAYSASCWW